MTSRPKTHYHRINSVEVDPQKYDATEGDIQKDLDCNSKNFEINSI